jgi:hypothetical protein
VDDKRRSFSGASYTAWVREAVGWRASHVTEFLSASDVLISSTLRTSAGHWLVLSDPYNSEGLCAPIPPSMTILRPNSMTKESQVAELGGVHTGDESELARMGYKQELK